jgi:4-amino-4-deoxychorismate lyase
MTRWLINGEPGDAVPVMDRGLHYGDGLFETVAVRDGRARFLERHLERLSDGCRRLSINGLDPEMITTEVRQLTDGCDRGTIKILVTRSAGDRGYAPPDRANSNRMIGMIPEDAPSETPWRTGIDMKFCVTRIAIDPDLAGMKTLGRLNQVLARAELTGSTCAEGVMCTADGQAICGTMSNLFLVRDSRLTTPALDRCGVNGVMRRLVLEQARRGEFEIRETVIGPDDLLGASEIFVTNSRIGIWPVVRLESTPYEIGPTTRQLMASLAGIGVTECGA